MVQMQIAVISILLDYEGDMSDCNIIRSTHD